METFKLNQQNRFTKNFNQWDKTYSTYRHKIYFNDGNFIDGYSKGLNVDEPFDKTKLLINVISRLLNSGYLMHPSKNTYKIEFYKRDLSKLKQNEELILTLYPESYKLGDYAEINCNLVFSEFLKQTIKLMLDVHQGKEVNFKKETKPKSTPQPNSQNMFIYKNMNRNELHNKCVQLLEKGFERGRVEGYWFSMLEKGFVID